MRGICAISCAALAIMTGSVRAETQPGKPAAPNLGVSVRTGYWSTGRQLNGQPNYASSSLWFNASDDLGNGLSAKAEGWLLDERSFAGWSRQRADLRDAYLAWHNDSISLTLGRRVISWGRADWLNPTDVVTARDYTLMFIDDSDLRRGSAVATAAYSFGDMSLTMLWAPEFRPNVYPLQAVPGLALMQDADRLDANQYGVRLDRTGSGFDWSVSYFNGRNRNPGARLDSLSPAGMVVDAQYGRVQMLGADFATNLGGFGIRGEVAYSVPAANGGSNLFAPRPALAAVLGVDHAVFENWNVNVQYIVHQTFSFSDISQQLAGLGPLERPVARKAALLNNQLREFQHGPSMRVTYSAWNDTLLFDVIGAAFVSDGGFMIRAKATYSITDHLKAMIGADIFRGPASSFFGQLRENTAVISQIRYDF